MSSVLDKVSLACRVQHHPSRAALLDELLPRLNGLHPQVVTDPGGRQRSTWRTHRLCLESIPDDATHLLCIQDDAWPCRGFAAAIRAAIEERPDRIIAAFMPGVGHLRRRFDAERARGSRWMDMPSGGFVPLVCTVYPREHALEIPAYADRKKIPLSRSDDGIVAAYARAHRITASCTVPCLCQHRDDVASTMGMPSGRRHPHRVAIAFADDLATPDPTSPFLSPPLPAGP